MQKRLTQLNENIIQASGFKTIGQSVELDKMKLQMASISVSSQKNEKILKAVSGIDDDSQVSPIEKKSLATQWDAIRANWLSVKKNAEEDGLSLEETYADAENAFASLSGKMSAVLADMSSTYYDKEPNSLASIFSLYYIDLQELNEQIMAYEIGNAKVAREAAITEVLCIADMNYVKDGETATVNAIVKREGIDITETVDSSALNWKITGTADDSAWNAAHMGMRSVTIPYAVISGSGVSLSCEYSQEII